MTNASFTPFTSSILASLCVSLISLIGLFVVNPALKHQGGRKSILNYEIFFLSFAVSSLLSDVVFHLLWHGSRIGVFLGIVFSFVMHVHLGESSSTACLLNIISDGIHNFLDGTSLAVAFMVSQRVGIVTTIAIACHEIPQEISDYYILLRGGWSKKKAIAWNFASALLCIAGTAIGWRFITETTRTHAIGITSGAFLYLILAEMMPDLSHQLHSHSTKPAKNASQSRRKMLSAALGFGIGCAIMYGAEYLEHAVEHTLEHGHGHGHGHVH